MLFLGLTLGFGAALVLAPASRAQSEVDPDHFDGTDSWAVAANAKVKPAAKPGATPAVRQARAKRTAAPVLTAANDSSPARKPELVAVQDKRKPVRKPKNQ